MGKKESNKVCLKKWREIISISLLIYFLLLFAIVIQFSDGCQMIVRVTSHSMVYGNNFFSCPNICTKKEKRVKWIFDLPLSCLNALRIFFRILHVLFWGNLIKLENFILCQICTYGYNMAAQLLLPHTVRCLNSEQKYGN